MFMFNLNRFATSERQWVEAQVENAKEQAVLSTLKSQISSDKVHIHPDNNSLRYLLCTLFLWNFHVQFKVLTSTWCLNKFVTALVVMNQHDKTYSFGAISMYSFAIKRCIHTSCKDEKFGVWFSQEIKRVC